MVAESGTAIGMGLELVQVGGLYNIEAQIIKPTVSTQKKKKIQTYKRFKRMLFIRTRPLFLQYTCATQRSNSILSAVTCASFKQTNKRIADKTSDLYYQCPSLCSSKLMNNTMGRKGFVT